MTGFSMGVTTVYITEAFAFEWDLCVASESYTLLSSYNKIRRLLRGEMHRWKGPYTFPELMRFHIWRTLSENMSKGILVREPTPSRTAAKHITMLLGKVSEQASGTI